MHRIDSSGNVAGAWSNGTPPLTPGTAMDAPWFNAVQEEIINIIETHAGITLVKNTNTQLWTALAALFGQLSVDNTWTGEQNFNDQVDVNAGLYVLNDVMVDGGLSLGDTAIMQDIETQAAQLYTLLVLHGAVLNETLNVGGLLSANGRATLKSPTAATGSTAQTATTVKDGYLVFDAVNPNSNVGFTNTITPGHISKAWCILATDGLGGVSIVDGINVTSVALNAPDIEVTFAAPFASGTYGVSGSVEDTFAVVNKQSTSTASVAKVRAGNAGSGSIDLTGTPFTIFFRFDGRQ